MWGGNDVEKGENMGIMASERGGVGGCRSYDLTKSFENTDLSDHLKNVTLSDLWRSRII